ncbi:secondary thiamine-phosphate synthase enzyme YjbQ [Alteromonas sp. ASW11-36]|uniref:Secondary thiamine-phosphate synthase enzyme YjbQ n=1 Tax=Alteromonas arenosi TaxID=3055817 RepID=A0ABT7SSV7_9ALTE|nr:secondary thiamine-phosphate synthase enzyme YjbQ [Alteromonas sp. ASW11-36]MDM7859069.1 secondary thiamine-phosphate synthase enzyme YjbQ [Alteromonas sp. ASW11-36]
MHWQSKQVVLPEYRRGFHLVTQHIVDALPQIRELAHGMLHISLLHTSASLSINENADPSVRKDMETFFNRLVPDENSYFIHTFEGQDDMPAHVKSSLLGSQLSLAIESGQLVLGTWQGIYLGEHRDRGGKRKLHLSLFGDPA